MTEANLPQCINGVWVMNRLVPMIGSNEVHSAEGEFFERWDRATFGPAIDDWLKNVEALVVGKEPFENIDVD